MSLIVGHHYTTLHSTLACHTFITFLPILSPKNFGEGVKIENLLNTFEQKFEERIMHPPEPEFRESGLGESGVDSVFRSWTLAWISI